MLVMVRSLTGAGAAPVMLLRQLARASSSLPSWNAPCREAQYLAIIRSARRGGPHEGGCLAILPA